MSKTAQRPAATFSSEYNAHLHDVHAHRSTCPPTLKPPLTSRPPYFVCRLCKIKYYNNCLFYNVQRNFLVQTGDPTNTGRGGDSINGVLYGEQARFFDDELRPQLKHKKKGMLGMASAGPDQNASQFYLTTGEDLHSLDEKHTLFGEVAEGWDVLEAINDAPCDDDGRPLQNIRYVSDNKRIYSFLLASFFLCFLLGLFSWKAMLMSPASSILTHAAYGTL